MNSLKIKSNTGLTLFALFAVTLTTGVILHLKKHGIIVEPRSILKVIHWIAGSSMAVCVCLHGTQFWKAFFYNFKKRSLSGVSTMILIVFIIAVVMTGWIKLVSPVKIHGLGMWHYWLGVIMSVAAVIHLVRGIPMLVKMIRAGREIR